MRKITLFLMSLFLTVGAMAQEGPTVAGVKNIPTVKVDLSQGLKTGYYLLKQVNNNNGSAGGQGVGWIKAASEEAGASATSKNTGTPDANGVTYIWYVEVTDAANNLITISTANKVAAWQAPWQHQKNLVAYSSRATLKYHTGTVNLSGNATPKEGSCFISNEGTTAFVHFSGDNLGSWTDTNQASMFMVEFYEIETSNIVYSYQTEDVGNPTEDGVYRVYWKGQERGYLAYHNDYPTKPVLADVNMSGYNGIDKHYKSTEDGVQREWYLITSASGKKYLFSPYTGKFLTYSKDAADSGKGALYDTNRPLEIAVESNTHTDWNGYYILTATIDDVKYLLSSGCGTDSRGNKAGYPVRWAKAEGDGGQMHDGGSPLTFVKVKGFPVDEAILAHAQAAINDYENPVEANVNFEWTTSTPWTAVEHSAYYTSTVFNDNELNGVKYIEGEVTIDGARTATVTFSYIDGGHKLNIRGVEVIDAMGNIVAGDYHVGIAGGTTNTTGNVYTVSVAKAGTYKVRCYAAEGGGDQFNMSHGSIVVSFAKLNVMDLTKSVTFAAEYATLYLGYNVTIPAGVEAYVLTGVNPTWVELTQLNNIIPANTAVILKGTANSSYNFYYTSDEADDVEINYLEGSIADRYVQGDAYVLGVIDGEVCLAPALLNKVNNTSFKNNANKAYLKVAPGAVMSASLRFDFDGTTGVEEVETEVAETVIYDLTGRRVNEITKAGVYIINGKKTLVK